MTALPARFWAKVDKTDRCWLWAAGRSRGGYGAWHPPGAGTTLYAHRVAYESLVGPIPEGLQLDHLCRVRHCVNPTHLEPVTHAENQHRGERAQKKECLRGHRFDAANTYFKPTASGVSRQCRECRNAWHRAYRARQRRTAA